MYEKQSQLRVAWDAILEVYLEFAKVCNAHNLKHWVAYGTLLGAVRHKGFIPWDDDVDVHMLRKDFDRFLEIAEKELPTYLKIVKWQNTAEYPYIFFKVQDTRKEVWERVCKESLADLPQGIYIDVFALDGVPDGIISKAIDAVKRYVLYARASYLFRKGKHAGLRGVLGEIAGRFCGWWFRDLLIEHDLTRIYDGWARKYSEAETRQVGYYYGHLSGWEFKVSRNLFKDTVNMPFEQLTVPCPAGYEKYLETLYGDYMTLPPIEKRVSVHWGEAPWKFGPTDNMNQEVL